MSVELGFTTSKSGSVIVTVSETVQFLKSVMSTMY